MHLDGILFPHINDDAGQNHIKLVLYMLYEFEYKLIFSVICEQIRCVF